VWRHLKGGTTLILDDLDLRSSDEIEEEADKFAEDAPIPHDLLDRCSSDRPTTSDIVDSAMEAGIHPAIVAGRWQRKHNEYRRFAKMLGHGEVSTHLQ
jgi:HTH-type transcriptional regulator/antitoxin HigA